ncbi:MAG: hypothetical protein COA74_08910 [Gammaproteobacteria bacterium]|nr:MAG: hypothetical protein COA74_08910 [Gammaproteobacteria bacterium]
MALHQFNIAKIILLASTLTLMLSSVRAEVTEKPISINLITEINHPYVFYKEDSNELTGLAYDLIIELLKRSNVKADVTVLPWLRAIKMLDSTDNTCLFIMNRTPLREKKYTWVGPMHLGYLTVYKVPSSPIVINSISDISQYLVIGKTDGIALRDLKEKIDFKALYTSSDEQSARLLYRGRGELWATGNVDGPMATKKLGLPLPIAVFQNTPTDLSMGCSLKLLPATLEKLIEANDSMSDFRKIIIDKYLHQ